jgi:capsular polysaccharide biosynthesis protein
MKIGKDAKVNFLIISLFMSIKVVKITPPINANARNPLYAKRTFELFPQKVLYVNNVDVTHDGICFKNSKLIRESVQAYPDKIKLFELEGKYSIENLPFIEFGGNDMYLLVHHPWFNYYHWLTESIPRIWMVRKDLEKLVLLLPAYYEYAEYVQDSLRPFKFKDIIYFKSGYNIHVHNAIIPQIKPLCSSYDPEIINDLRSMYYKFAKSVDLPDNDLSKRIYILRGNSQRRRIINEDELIKLLSKYDFSSINAESYSFFEQVRFSNETLCLISNGSGLTNMLFMPELSHVVNLEKKITNPNDFHDKVLWHLSSVLNLRYCSLICDPVNKKQDMYIADLKININALEKLLVRILNCIK